jgi:chromosome segregation ATPase
VQGLTGVFSLRGQIAAQEKRNVDLAASNTSLRKANAELTAERENYSLNITELKSRNEELGDNYAELVRVKEKLSLELDAARKDLAKEKAVNSGLREELESVTLKAQTIAVDAVLSARAELMEEFKKGEHADWDPDQEIETWRKREAVLAAGEDESDAEGEDEAPAVGSPGTQEAVADPEHVEPDVGAEAIAPEAEDVAASEEDLAKD